ncbi:putative Beta-1,3-galactosyltransferase 1 [Hypsibius exemplaris]|uniref:Hexosyltransferase n=1 Tax=Hypsibius exemplaris TaxID=2072580 RepID=A0A1W0XAZ5_HYPEX|nr:putative Beta-1,3-galactosyltransferase 1 [Hypsibius exemplaris]
MAPARLYGLIVVAILSGVFLFATLKTWGGDGKETGIFDSKDYEWHGKPGNNSLLKSLLERNELATARRRHAADPYYLDPRIIAKQYDIMPKPCSAFIQKPFLLLIVFARPDGFTIRQAVRKTWASLANPICGVRVLFMFGRVYDHDVQTKLNQEAEKYGDVIQSNQFDDKYRAAAHKAIHLLQWGGTFCPESTYTAKMDDDNWLNLPKYYKFLQANQHTDYVFGAMFGAGTTVLRDPSSKYYVPKEEFPSDYYPEYLSGILYAFKTKFLPKVVHVAKHPATGQITFNDDVYMCGVVATAAGLTRKEVPDYAWDHNIRDSTCPKRDKMCIHYSKIEDFYRLWNDPCYRYEELC